MAAPVALLDVNVLIALLDPQHLSHEPAHRWFQAYAGTRWATCPLTQNALLRIFSTPPTQIALGAGSSDAFVEGDPGSH